MKRQLFSCVVIAVVVGSVPGCTESAQEPTAPEPAQTTSKLNEIVIPLCQVGCLDVDPFPNAPGYFLGSGVTPSLCFYGDYTDGDQDGLGDFCEKKLAAAFAPQLYYYNFDNVAREPRWAARIMSGDVLIAYLLSYYRDEGSTNTSHCQLPFISPECAGHNGDSEYIMLRVYYTEATQHWVLGVAQYSQHTGWATYLGGTNPYPTQLYYPDRPGGYPRSYVAQGKHANYASISECNSGGGGGTDYCGDVNTAARVSGGEWLNIGSRQYPFIDCVATSNTMHPQYGNGRLECYWTNQSFFGWYSSAQGDPPTSYSTHLANFGF